MKPASHLPTLNGTRLAKAQVEGVRNFLCGYRLCVDMLNLRRYERRNRHPFDEACDCDDLLCGSESYWRARLYEVGLLIDSMPNGREKTVLYYRYIRGESIERAANLMGVSRRTGYRLHLRGLIVADLIFARLKREGAIFTDKAP